MTADDRAVLFDIDGTLVDSNYLHVDAWARALDQLWQPVEAWRIHRSIGQDSSLLLASLVGERDEEWNARASALNAELYAELIPRLRAFAGARELLRALASRGARVVLATSAPEAELTALRAVLDSEAEIHAVTSADDVEQAKPDPGIIAIALERAGVPAKQAVMIGDSTWDMEAAGRAKVRAIGVLTGGFSAQELTDAGASVVVESVAELLERLDEIDIV